MPLRPGHEIEGGTCVGAAGMGVVDVGGEELHEVEGCFGAGVDDHRRQMTKGVWRQGEGPADRASLDKCRSGQKLGVHSQEYNGWCSKAIA